MGFSTHDLLFICQHKWNMTNCFCIDCAIITSADWFSIGNINNLKNEKK